MGPESNEIFQWRLDKSAPTLNQLKAWAKKSIKTAVPGQKPHKAFSYLLNLREVLINYLKDDRLEVDNNGTEREISPLLFR